jgi:hypothetical protein
VFDLDSCPEISRGAVTRVRDSLISVVRPVVPIDEPACELWAVQVVDLDTGHVHWSGIAFTQEGAEEGARQWEAANVRFITQYRGLTAAEVFDPLAR